MAVIAPIIAPFLPRQAPSAIFFGDADGARYRDLLNREISAAGVAA